MESYLGSFRMNVYFFGGFLLYDIVGMLAFAVTHVSINLTMYYILIAMYLMLGLLMPEESEALLCASYKDEVDGACLLRDVCI